MKLDKLSVGGGPDAKATYNIPYSLLIPKFETMTPTGCTIKAQARTISAASVNGTEAAYQDKGYTEVSLGQKTYFDTPRMVASAPNESQYLSDLPGNKSLSMVLNLAASDPRLSPMVNLEHASCTFVNNRINRPITDFASDFRVNSSLKDPDRFFS